MSVTCVVKVGGDIFRSGCLAAVAADVASLTVRGDRVVLVHGGGRQATALQTRLGQSPKVVAGRRITDADALEVMKMAVAGQLNVDLCATLLGAGAKPVGLHGASSRAIEATKRPPTVVSGGGPEPIDFGHVGNVVGFNTELLSLLSQAGYVPVLSSLGVDAHANVLNINADIVANRLAAALGADHLVLVTGAPGVLRDVTDPSSRIATLTVVEARRAIDDGIVAGGMIPKLEETIGVLAAGQLAAAHIVGGIAPGDILRELDAPGSVGTALLG